MLVPKPLQFRIWRPSWKCSCQQPPLLHTPVPAPCRTCLPGVSPLGTSPSPKTSHAPTPVPVRIKTPSTWGPTGLQGPPIQGPGCNQHGPLTPPPLAHPNWCHGQTHLDILRPTTLAASQDALYQCNCFTLPPLDPSQLNTAIHICELF